MMGEVLVNAALISIVAGAGVLIALKGCSLLGRRLANCRKAQTTALIPESPEEVFLFTGQPNYSALRNRTTQLRADEAARAG